jgi:anaerobic magnesium-protoporphyrin IX monomethyl ester cyclase
MAKILIINPRVREEDVPRHVPYGLALLAAVAMEKGHLVQVYDENAWRQGEDTIREVCQADDWTIIALGGITTCYNSLKECVKWAREACPSATIVVGGGVITSLPHEMLTWMPEIDVGCVGEGMVTFPEICQMVDNDVRDWTQIDGTISRRQDGSLALSNARKLVHDLDSWPYPAWDLFPLEEVYLQNSEMLYSEEGMLASRRLDINASYGCSLICRYCYHLGLSGDMKYEQNEAGENIAVHFDEPGDYTRAIRYHSPEYIVRMAKHMYDKYRINFVAFLDENLMTMDKFSGRTWMEEICRLWHEYGLVPKKNEDGTWEGVHWSGTSHATLSTPEILKTMRAAGCSHLVYGYESFAPHVLKTIGKGSSVKTNEKSFFATLETGIRPIPNMIIGFPNEDFDSIKMNIAAWDRLGIMVKPHFATPYPGSEWFTTFRDSIVEQYDGYLEKFISSLGDASAISAVISHNFNAVELLGLRELMLQRDIRSIDAYERQWRRNHKVPDDHPSTLVPELKTAKVARTKGVGAGNILNFEETGNADHTSAVKAST